MKLDMLYEGRRKPININDLRKKIIDVMSLYPSEDITVYHCGEGVGLWDNALLSDPVTTNIPFYTVELPHSGLQSNPQHENLISALIKIGNNNGWYARERKTDGGRGVIFVANYTTEVHPKTIYHIATIDNANKIKKSGIKPKSGMRYTSRVYLLDNYNLAVEYLKHYWRQLSTGGIKDIKTLRHFAIITIDPNKVDGRFYRDLEWQAEAPDASNELKNTDESVFWTYAHIRPEAIKSIEPIDQSVYVPNPQRICHKCQTQNRAEANFCKKCGNYLLR